MDFFNSIVDFIEVAFNFLSNMVSSLVIMIQVVTNAAGMPIHFTGIVCSFLGASMLSVVGIGILFKIVGR